MLWPLQRIQAIGHSGFGKNKLGPPHIPGMVYSELGLSHEHIDCDDVHTRLKCDKMNAHNVALELETQPAGSRSMHLVEVVCAVRKAEEDVDAAPEKNKHKDDMDIAAVLHAPAYVFW